MKIQHLKTDPNKRISWASGTSTELYIYPENSSFKGDDFNFRVSIATVEQAQTVFTSLPGVSRTLMVLQGKLALSHNGQSEKELRPFDLDTFDGNSETRSVGLSTNFNVMCKGATQGELDHVFAWMNTTVEFELTADFELFYILSGSATINEIELAAGDLLIVEKEAEIALSLQCVQSCNMVHCAIDIKST